MIPIQPVAKTYGEKKQILEAEKAKTRKEKADKPVEMIDG
jgi:hypothetical protein